MTYLEVLDTIFTLEVQIVLENFSVSMLLMEVAKCYKIVEFPKISINMENFKTFYESETASRWKEIIQRPIK